TLLLLPPAKIIPIAFIYMSPALLSDNGFTACQNTVRIIFRGCFAHNGNVLANLYICRNDGTFADRDKSVTVTVRLELIRRFFKGAKLRVLANLGILGDDGLLNPCPGLDHSTVHDDGISDESSLFHRHSGTDDRVIDLSVNLCPLSDDASAHLCIFREILRRKHGILRVNPPELFVQIKLRYDVDQLHVGFPVSGKRSHVLPVSLVIISHDLIASLMTIRDDMHTKVTSGLILKALQRVLQDIPVENIDTHG